MIKCYICDSALTKENQTFEHIILNAAGGRLKSKDLLCKNCNSSFGENIDSVLAEQLNYLANMLMIKRESLLKLFKVKDIAPHGKLEEVFNKFLWLNRKRQNKYIIGRIVNQSYTETIGKHSEGNSITN